MADRAHLYGGLARHYDVLYQWKNYRTETQLFERLARKYGRSGGHRWLDVACGTGRHLDLLRPHWDVAGVDLSPDMLRIARRRLPGVRLVRADMRSFDLGTRFDVVSCLFSAIGHLRTERDLVAAFRRFAHHLVPGGVLILEPWIDPKHFLDEHLAFGTETGPTVRIARAARSVRRGSVARIEYAYLVVEEGRGIQRFDEVQESRLTPPRRMVELLARAGLKGRVLPSPHFPERGVIVATKSGER